MSEKSGNKISIDIGDKIYVLRGQRVMLDEDLAKLYQVETKRLNEQVKRNIQRFPGDFMFRLTIEEAESLRSQFATSNAGRGGRRFLPLAFTEHGVAMLSSILGSEIAIQVNIWIIRAFAKMRELVSMQKDILTQLDKLEKKVTGHDEDITLIFQYIKQLLNPPEQPRNRIGFRRKDEE